MILKFFEALFGTKSSRDVARLKPRVEAVNALEPEFQALTDEALKAKTAEFRERLAGGETVDVLLPEAFAAVREAARRAIGLRHFDVQLLGGMVLHQGKIAEMKTGEGKTLVATLAIYLNALTGLGAHVVTVNDYLARRDMEWMGPVYEFLGLSVGFVQHDMDSDVRRASYACDITYVTNNEIGFDYLRDNMVVRREDRVMRPLNFAVVDEVDSILVDEARTPLIISGAAEDSTDKYRIINQVMPHLKVRFITETEEIQSKYTGEDLGAGYDAIIDEKAHTATLTEEGALKCEKLLGVGNLYDDIQSEWIHHITQALRAHHLYQRDVEYVVKDSEVIIVDEFTGRLMPGRRWSEGLHQAVEAKENLPVNQENQTLATITFQNFFKLYKKLSGMTGTAMTEAQEFWEIYKLDAVEIPPNRTNHRSDFPDLVYRTEREKNAAIVEEVEELWKKGQPVLVGTRSIEKSEKLSGMLRPKGIPHQVLNAKYHEMEAQIIAQAGKKGAVTIATNMAGRGTDIILGGNPPDLEEQKLVVTSGGLHILGTERHEARRIDNQLRGRSGRQGDPGSSRFYLSLQDELLRLFGSEKLSVWMEKLGMEEGEVIESGLVSRQIEGAQRRVESMNFDIRKQLLDYDNVMNKQREVVYSLRNEMLDSREVTAHIDKMLEETVDDKVDVWCPSGAYPEAWEIEPLAAWLRATFSYPWSPTVEEVQRLDRETLREELRVKVAELYRRRAADFVDLNRQRDPESRRIDFKEIERMVLLQVIDRAWKDHLYDLDHLKKGISLRAYAQKDPLIEYQQESFTLFEAMLGRVRDRAIEYLFRIEALPPAPRPQPALAGGPGAPGAGPLKAGPLSPSAGNPPQADGLRKIGRNDPCYCGSGKKYKKCHGV